MHITVPIYAEPGDVFERGSMDGSVGRELTVRLPAGPCVGCVVAVEYTTDRSHVMATIALPVDADLRGLVAA